MREVTSTLTLDLDNLVAAGEIEVVDYTQLIGVEAQGTIEILNYELLHGVAASAEITVADYEELTDAVFTIGEDTITEGVDYDAETSNSVTATNLAAAIDALDDYAATADGAVVTIVYATVGVAGNAIHFENSSEGLTFPTVARLDGGFDAGVVTIGETELVEGTDFDAETDEATTATNLAAAIDALDDYAATADGAVVTIVAEAIGAEFNTTVNVTPEVVGVETAVSFTDIEGGLDEGSITVSGTELLQGTDFDAETDNNTTAANIATAVDGIEGVSATADGAVVTIAADVYGAAGNSTITTNSTGVTVSGLSGGSDTFNTDVADFNDLEIAGVSGQLRVVSVTPDGEDPVNVSVVLMHSFDKENWEAVEDTDTTSNDVEEGTVINVEGQSNRPFFQMRVVIQNGVAEARTTIAPDFFFESVGGTDDFTFETMRAHTLLLHAADFIPFLNENALADNLTTEGGELSTVDGDTTAVFDTDGYVATPVDDLAMYFGFNSSNLNNEADAGSAAEGGTDTTTVVVTGNPARQDDFIHNRTRSEYTQVTVDGGATLTVNPAVTGQTTGDIISFSDLYLAAGSVAYDTVFGLPAISVEGDTGLTTYLPSSFYFPSSTINIGFSIEPRDVSSVQLISITPPGEAGDLIGIIIQANGTLAFGTFDEELAFTPIVESAALTINTPYKVWIDYDGADTVRLWINGSIVDTATGVTLSIDGGNETFFVGVDAGEGLAFAFDGKIGDIAFFSAPPEADMDSFFEFIWNDGSPRAWDTPRGNVVAVIEDSETYQRTIPTSVSSVRFAPVYSGNIADITAFIEDSGNTLINNLTVNGETTVSAPADVKDGNLVIEIAGDTKLHGYYLLCKA